MPAQEFFKRVLNEMDDGVVACNENGELTYFNPSLRKRLGLPSRGFEGRERTFYEVFHADGTAMEHDSVPLFRSLSGERVVGASMVVVPKATGERVHFLVNASPIIDKKGRIEGAIAVAHDITQLVEAQSELADRERVLAALMDRLPGIVYRCENQPEWPLLFVSSGCFELTGRTSQDLMAAGRGGLAQVIHPDDRDAVWSAVQEALERREKFEMTYRIVKPDGEMMWVWEQGSGLWDDSGELRFLEGLILDITERVNAQRSLSESEQRFRELFDNVIEGIFRVTVSGEPIFFNPAFARMFGFDSVDEAIAAFRKDKYSFYDEGESRDRLLADLDKYGEVRDRVLALRRKDGQRAWVKENSRAIRSETGEMVALEGTLEDITARVEAETELLRNKERFARAIAGANDGIWDWDLEEQTVFYSPRWHEQLGYEPGSLSSSINEWFDRIHADDFNRVDRLVRSVLSGEATSFELEHRVRNSQGSYVWMLAKGARTFSETEQRDYLSGALTDISDRKRVELRLQHDALHDSLTGLPNRALLKDRLSQAIRMSKREKGRLFSLLFVDLDRFKHVNDGFGHSVGDELLVEVGRRWSKITREYDTLARLGGDEFALLVERTTTESDAVLIARKLLAQLEIGITVAGRSLSVGASIGIRNAAEESVTAEDMIRDADLAMYRAKSLGSNQIVVFENAMRNTAMETFHVETELRAALRDGYLKLYYQPIVSIEDKCVKGYEALIRWLHPDRGMISPMEFIPLAEESGLIVDVDKWVLKEACRQISEWKRARVVGQDIYISVNLSARQMGRLEFPDEVRETLEAFAMPPSSLTLELTESAIITNMDTAKEIMDRLNAIGVGVVLDDFGTGYSSLSYLYQFPFKGIKVDQSFVRQLDRTKNVDHLMQLVQSLGERMAVHVVPEGIETLEELQRLASMGFKYAQGFYLGRPIPSEDVEKSVGTSATTRL